MNRNSLSAWLAAIARRIAWALAVVAAMMPSVGAQAFPPEPDEAQAWPEVETVRTLLRADAAAALADCRVSGICPPGSAVASREPLARPEDDIRVAAIFGSAKRLSAEVLVNGALLHYQAGRAAPVAGAVFVAGGYRLLAIDGACVRLRREGVDLTACLDAGSGTP
ncbi:hypothetical protein [Achromobacter pestifer]|uniref:Uncharacterized protein n=1 Tax=Achromobacter pestifer TaxID=1353889 RepID=A0A6S6ZLU7_9BURK|nr:hypothetical protein [Achromobacter pestifer]CAB3682492.1 hypothetical protein LMG3431_04437 [Achromobacter pestifer]